MPKFSANLTLLFNELDFLDRFQAAKDAGFKGVEYLFPLRSPNAGRGEPGTGEINYPFLFAFIDKLGYLRLDRLRIQARQRYRAGPRLDQTLPVTQERA
jgi:hydroxypyruvate isomerase